MRFHPVLSIFFGFVAIFIAVIILEGTLGSFSNSSPKETIFLIVSNLILIAGGFIATYFAKERKIRYGVYVGVMFAAVIAILAIGRISLGYNRFVMAVFLLSLFSLMTGFGGFLEKMTEKNYRESFKIKLWNNGFNPILAIIIGLIVAEVCADLLELITGTMSYTTISIIVFVIGVTSLIIGGFVTTFLVKKKKIHYSIYVGVIAITFSLLKFYTEMRHGLIIHESYYIRAGSYIIYLLSAGVGGYLGIIVSKRLKQKH